MTIYTLNVCRLYFLLEFSSANCFKAEMKKKKKAQQKVCVRKTEELAHAEQLNFSEKYTKNTKAIRRNETRNSNYRFENEIEQLLVGKFSTERAEREEAKYLINFT